MTDKQSSEFSNFDRMMHKLIKVPHNKIREKLEAEKRDKLGKRKDDPNVRSEEKGRQNVRN